MIALKLKISNNISRKFIPTKKEYLQKYLNEIKKIKEYKIIQTYKDEYEYRLYKLDDFKYLKNNKIEPLSNAIKIKLKDFNDILNKTSKKNKQNLQLLRRRSL